MEFVVKIYIVTYDAIDVNGNVADQVTRNVVVADTTPPNLSTVFASPAVLWPPNHKMKSVEVEVMGADSCDSQPPICLISSVSSNEPEKDCGKKDAGPDWEITGDLTVDLRAERCGNGDSRTYTISVTCADGEGNTSSSSAMVTVPHDQGG